MEIRSTELKATLEAPFHCEKCDLYRMAQVEAIGNAGTVPGIHSAEEGEHKARTRAERFAEDTLKFVPCPKCGQLPAGGGWVRLRVALQYFVVVPAIVLVVGFFAAFIQGYEADEMLLIVAAAEGVLLLFMTGFYLFGPTPWKRAPERTTLESFE